MKTNFIKDLAQKNLEIHREEKPLERAIQSDDRENHSRFTCYVPKNFNISKLVIENPPGFNYDIDKFNYIVHLINDIPSGRKKNQEDGFSYAWEEPDYPYTSFYSPLLQAKIHDYKKYLNYLIENDVLVCDNLYIKGKKSRGYKFTGRYQTDVKAVKLTNRVFIRRIRQFVELTYDSLGLNSEHTKVDITAYGFLSKWLNEKLTVDYAEAIDFLEEMYNKEVLEIGHEKAIRKKNLRRIPIEKIHRASFSMTVDSTAGRIHTVITQLKSELRQFIKYDGEKLVSVDIKNSQPFFLTKLINPFELDESIFNLINKVNPKNNFKLTTDKPYYVSKNTEKYIRMVSSGKLYEHFIDILIEEGILDPNDDFDVLRKKAKMGIISAIFSPNTAIGYDQFIKVFSSIFPDVYEIIKAIKYGKGKHNTLAIVLQSIEAMTVIDKASRIISEMNSEIPLFTLHDAIITTEKHVDIVEMVLHETLLEEIGIEPTLKREFWSA